MASAVGKLGLTAGFYPCMALTFCSAASKARRTFMGLFIQEAFLPALLAYATDKPVSRHQFQGVSELAVLGKQFELCKVSGNRFVRTANNSIKVISLHNFRRRWLKISSHCCDYHLERDC